MQVRADQLAASLQRGLKPLYMVHGDEPLLAQEAGDLIRASARAAGYDERKVFNVSGAHFDWSGVLGAAQEMSLFAQRQLIEIRMPSGKPGKDGSEALQRYVEHLSDDVLTLVQLPAAGRPADQERLVRRARRLPAWSCASSRWSAPRCRPGSRNAWRARISACMGGEAGPADAGLLCRSRRGQPAGRAPGDPEARRCCTRAAS